MNLSSFGAGALDTYDQSTDFLNEPLFPELPDLQTIRETSSSLQQNVGSQLSVSSAVQPNSISPPSVSSAFQPKLISQSRVSSASQANRKSQQQAYTIGVRKKKSSGASSTDACPKPQSASATQDSTIVEDLRPQLLEGIDLNSESEEPIPKDGRDETKDEPARKRARIGDEIANATTIAINGLVVEMQGVRARMSRKESSDEKTEKAIVDATSVLSKLVDSVNRLRSSIEDSSKEEKRREERRQDREKKREEERRKEREEDIKREDRRWEAERKDRQDMRRFLALAEKWEEERRDERQQKKATEGDKENATPVSTLGRHYTENSIRDFGKRKDK